jgi:two-component system KDP operon response regulator KdpE
VQADAIIVDLALPDQNGIDVIKVLRGRTRNPLIVLSGSTAGAGKVAALDAGADDYVAEPFDAADSSPACAPPCGAQARSAPHLGSGPELESSTSHAGR